MAMRDGTWVATACEGIDSTGINRPCENNWSLLSKSLLSGLLSWQQLS